MNLVAALIALALERFVAVPAVLFERIGHPVQWMGWFIAYVEKVLNEPGLHADALRVRGAMMLIALLAVTGAAAFALKSLTGLLPLPWLFEAMLAVPLLAQRELAASVEAVLNGLRRSLQEGRDSVARIVGRDPEALDETGVSKAAIETLAENASDGVTAPLFYLAIFGLPGIAIYKAINTADSMVGHMNERYRHFGSASARLDDVANFIPARLTALMMAFAAAFTDGRAGARAWDTALRDGPNHVSTNAGWPEASMAGALGVSLGGPRSYGGETLELPEMGRHNRQPEVADIDRALTIYRRTLNLLLGLTAALVFLAALGGWV